MSSDSPMGGDGISAPENLDNIRQVFAIKSGCVAWSFSAVAFTDFQSRLQWHTSASSRACM
jgi:hypothetical protein